MGSTHQSSHSEFVVPLIRSLRDEIMQAYGQVSHSVKGNDTVVTEIDLKVEKHLTEALKKEFPDIGFHGEEHGRQGSQDVYWLIDPIDGTESYVRGLPGVTTIVALVEHGEVTQTYIYDPVTDIMYSAYKGMGAYENDKKIALVQRSIGRSLIAVSSGIPLRHPELMKQMKDAGLYYISQYYGAGCKAAYVASGKIDGSIIQGKPGPWDHAPARMLMQEAGAELTTFDEPGIDSTCYALLSPTINDSILPIIRGVLA